MPYFYVCLAAFLAAIERLVAFAILFGVVSI